MELLLNPTRLNRAYPDERSRKDAANDAADVLRWKLVNGEATSLAGLADPVAANGYTLCVYDAAALPQPRLSARAPAGGNWRASATGFGNRSPTRTPDGLTTAKLKAGAAGRPSCW